MTLTEDEAKRKQCQETFAAAHAPQACIGSHCMAWRWSANDSNHGYCGKAGKP